MLPCGDSDVSKGDAQYIYTLGWWNAAGIAGIPINHLQDSLLIVQSQIPIVQIGLLFKKSYV